MSNVSFLKRSRLSGAAWKYEKQSFHTCFFKIKWKMSVSVSEILYWIVNMLTPAIIL